MLHKLILPTNPINRVDSYQTFLAYNNLRGIMDFKNPDHVNLLNQWNEEVKTFPPTEYAPISPSNSYYNL